MLSYTKRQLIGLFLGMSALAFSLAYPTPHGMTPEIFHALGLAVLMITWWVCEVVPLAVTSCLPLILCPFLRLSSFKDIAVNYAHPVVFLLLGGFLLGRAVQSSGLHKRLMIALLSVMGRSPRLHVAGVILVTLFFSCWISNSATVILLLPIVVGMIEIYQASYMLKTTLLLALMYAANIGGMTTLIGTPPNAFVVGFLNDHYGVSVSFLDWFWISFPLVLLLSVVVWCWLCFFRGDLGGHFLPHVEESITSERRALGCMTQAEKTLSVVLLFTILAWFLRPAINRIFLLDVSDAGIAMLAASLLFLLPGGNRAGTHQRLLDWDKAREIPWGVLLLVGGGFALAKTLESSGLTLWLADYLMFLSSVPWFFILLLSVLSIVVLTEVNSNTATTMTFVPLLALLAVKLHIPVERLVLPAAYAASCAFMLPVATPTNAIVYSSEQINIVGMIRSGVVVNALACLVITIYGYYCI